MTHHFEKLSSQIIIINQTNLPLVNCVFLPKKQKNHSRVIKIIK